MKKIAILIFFLIVTINSYSQENNSLIGEWKVITIDTESFYLKTTNDSISLTKKYKEAHTDSKEVENYIKMVRLAYLNNRFFFDKKGNFNQTSDLTTFKSKYKIDEVKNVIKVVDTGLKGKNVNFEMPFKIIDNYLYITLIEASSKFVLIKVEK